MTTQAINPHSLEDIQCITSAELQAIIMELLNWSDDTLSNFIFETGLAYLQAYFGKDQEAIDLLSRSKPFWTWFQNHWTYRDQVFVESLMLNDCPLDFKIELYRGLHNPKHLACEIYPSSTVLGHSFSTIKMSMSCR